MASTEGFEEGSKGGDGGARDRLPARPGQGADETTEDAFLGGRLRLRQPLRGFRAGTDSMLLAAAVPAAPREAVLELGCGAGAAVLALGLRVPGLLLTGLEVQPAYAGLARRNAALNGVSLDVVEGDVAFPPPALRGGTAFDHVMMNPPFFDRGATTRAADPGRDLAHGGAAPLAAWLGLGARRLRMRGRLTLVQRLWRLPEVLAGLPPVMGAVEVLPLARRAGEEPSLMLLRARKGGRAPFRLLAALPVHGATGFAPAVEAALRDGAALPWG